MMKLAISNIAWEKDELDKYLSLMCDLGIHGLEMAPSIIWPEPITPSQTEIDQFVEKLNQYNIKIVSFQAIYYHQRGFNIFDENQHEKIFQYIDNLASVSSKVGNKVLVHGSPRSRDLQGRSLDVAKKQALTFFREIAKICEKYDVYYAIEPLNHSDNCEFVKDTLEAMEMVEEVGHPHFVLHFDSKTLTTGNEDFQKLIPKLSSQARHFHLSAINLEPICFHTETLDPVLKVLRDSDYKHYVSIEMRKSSDYEQNFEIVKKSLVYLKESLE